MALSWLLEPLDVHAHKVQLIPVMRTAFVRSLVDVTDGSVVEHHDVGIRSWMRPDRLSCGPGLAIIVTDSDGEIVAAIRMLFLADGRRGTRKQQRLRIEAFHTAVASRRDEFFEAMQVLPCHSTVFGDGCEVAQVVGRVLAAFIAADDTHAAIMQLDELALARVQADGSAELPG